MKPLEDEGKQNKSEEEGIKSLQTGEDAATSPSTAVKAGRFRCASCRSGGHTPGVEPRRKAWGPGATSGARASWRVRLAWQARSLTKNLAWLRGTQNHNASGATISREGSPRSLLVSGAKLSRSGQVRSIPIFQDSQAHHNGTYPLLNVSRGAVSTTWLNLGAATAKVVAQLDWEGGRNLCAARNHHCAGGFPSSGFRRADPERQAGSVGKRAE